MSVAVPQRLVSVPVAGLVPIARDEANAYLVEWGHNLGPVRRPFRSEAWALDVGGEPLGVAVTCSIVSPGVAGYEKTEVVELCDWCAREGRGVLASLRKRDLAVRRRSGTWEAIGASHRASPAEQPEVDWGGFGE